MTDTSIAILSFAAVVFGGSAAAKLHSSGAYRSFVAGLRETGLVPRRRLPATAAALAWAETATSAGLIAAAVLTGITSGGSQRTSGPQLAAAILAAAALTGALLLTAALTSGILVVMHRGTRARCACFGASSDRPLGTVHLIRNLFLLAALTAGLAAALLDRGHGAPTGAVIAAAVGAVTAVPLIRWEDLAELFLPIPTAGRAGSAGRHTGGYQ